MKGVKSGQFLSKILGIILKVDKETTLTNEPENKKTHDDA